MAWYVRGSMPVVYSDEGCVRLVVEDGCLVVEDGKRLEQDESKDEARIGQN